MSERSLNRKEVELTHLKICRTQVSPDSISSELPKSHLTITTPLRDFPAVSRPIQPYRQRQLVLLAVLLALPYLPQRWRFSPQQRSDPFSC